MKKSRDAAIPAFSIANFTFILAFCTNLPVHGLKKRCIYDKLSMVQGAVFAVCYQATGKKFVENIQVIYATYILTVALKCVIIVKNTQFFIHKE